MKNTFYPTLFLGTFLVFSFAAIAQDFNSTLPIVLIETNDEDIVDEPDILAQIKVIDNGDGNQHTLNDVPAFEGFITIEKRGNSSLGFPKSSYGFETADSQGNDMDTTLLGFPVEEDWILYSSWADKTFLRNALSMKLSREMGHYASRTRYCELFVNGDYDGVYLLMEKIKRDKNRVDIAKLKPEDIAGDELTGGYMLKFDWWEEPGWEASSETVTGNQLYIQYVYPKPEDLETEQENYIQSYIDSFELALFADNYINPYGKHFLDYLDAQSFADMIIINELSKNVDAYKLSTYFHKAKDSQGGKLRAGPIWDYDIAWYNSSYCEGGNYENWIYNENFCEDLEIMPLWWERLMENDDFGEIFCQRWQTLRNNILHQDSLLNWIDEQAQFLDAAQERNYDRWDSLNEPTWEHPEIAGSYEGEIENLKTFIQNRLEWMDANIVCEPLGGLTLLDGKNSIQLEVKPNPSVGFFEIDIKGEPIFKEAQVQVFSPLGELIIDKTDLSFSSKLSFELDLTNYASGLYFLKIKNEDGIVLQEKLLKIN